MKLLFQLHYVIYASVAAYDKIYVLEEVRKIWNLPVHLHLRTWGWKERDSVPVC